MDKRRLRAVSRYQFFQLKIHTLVLSGVLLLNLLLGILLKANGSEGGSIDLITFIFAFIIAFSMFDETFRFALYNGVSRRTFFLASAQTILLISGLWAILTEAAALLSRAFGKSVIIFYTIYPPSLPGMLLWYFGAIFCLISLCWFLTVLNSILSKRGRLVALGIFVLIGPAVLALDLVIPGLAVGVVTGILAFALFLLGALHTLPNSFFSALLLSLLGAVFLCAAWLLMRRRELR